MKFSLFAIAGLFTSALAAPAVVAQRQYLSELSILDELLSSIKVQTALINQTMAALPVGAAEEVVDVAVVTVGGYLGEISTLVVTATKNLPAAIAVRGLGDAGAVVVSVGAILTEVVATLTPVCSVVGLPALLEYLSPLEVALGGLLAALIVLVDGLLALVGSLLGSVLALLSGVGLGGILGTLNGLGLPLPLTGLGL